MGEEAQQRDIARHRSEEFSTNIQEVSAQSGMRTFLIDCSRKTSNKYEAVGSRAGSNNRSAWNNKCNGFNVKRGDQISVEAVCINSEGAAAGTIELNPGRVQGKQYTGNKVILEMGFTLTNNGRYSCVLPIKPPGGLVNQPVGGGGGVWTAEQFQDPQGATSLGFPSIFSPAGRQQMNWEGGCIPVGCDYQIIAPAPTYISTPMNNETALVSSASWGWTGYSRETHQCDGNYSMFRNKFYGGVAGKSSPAGGTLSQANPWLVNGANVVAGATPAASLSPPTNAFNAAGIAAPPHNGQMWSGSNPQTNNDNLPYIMMSPDFQPLMGLPPNNRMGAGDPVNEYPVNPTTGRREPPRPEPLKAFVVIDLKDYQFIDVNLLASLITQAFRQTNNVYRWDKIAEVEHSEHPTAHETKQPNALPYGCKWGCDLINAHPAPEQLRFIWDAVCPTFSGALYKTIPANCWIGSNMEQSSPDNTNYREKWDTDWLWAGAGEGVPSPQFPDITNPGNEEQYNIGRTGQPYLWNNQIYGNMGVRDFERWQLMYHFFHGDIYNLATDSGAPGYGTRLNVRRCVVMNNAIVSMVVKIESDPAGTGAGGQSGQNVNGVDETPAIPGWNIHEVSAIGSEETNPAHADFTGNLIYTNMEYTEYNLKRFSELFPQGEIYDGDLTGYDNQKTNDPKNFNYMLDLGVCNDALTANINVNPITGTGTAPSSLSNQEPTLSFDASARFSIITPYTTGSFSRTLTADGGDTGWFNCQQGSGGIFDIATPPVNYQDQVGTLLDHTQVDVATGLIASPHTLDRFHCCPSYTVSGLGGDGAAVGLGRSLGRIKVNSRYWNGWRDDAIWHPQEFQGGVVSVPGSCDATPTTLANLDDSLSRKYGVACYPYRWHPDGTQPALVKTLIMFRVAKDYHPQKIPGDTATGIATDPITIDLPTLELGRIEYRNFLGVSNAFNDNPAIIPMNSDDQRKTYFGGRTAAAFAAMPEDVPYNYQNYINVGATNATCEFNSDKARFELSYFYTPQTLSIAYQTDNDKGAAGVAQGGTEIATIQEEGIDANTTKSSIKFYPRQFGSNLTGVINEPCDGVGINDTLSGVFINKVWLVKPDTVIPAMETLNDYIDKSTLYATSQNYENITKDWIEATPDEWEGCLLSRMGYDYEDIFPPLGSNKNRFNEFTYASQAPKVCNESKKPGTMNSKTNIANSLFLDTFFDSQSAAPATNDITGLPLYGLGQNGFMGVNQIADTPAIRATNLPTLFDTPYYLIQTTGLIEPEGWMGLNGIIQPTIYYCMKNYAQSDYFYGYASTYALTAEKDHPVGMIHTEIRRPDTGELVPLGENSSVIYKIQRKLELPPLATDPEGNPLNLPEQPPTKEEQLLQEMVNLMKLQVRGKEGASTLIPFHRGQVGSGGGGRQEGISEGFEPRDPAIPQVGRLGGGALQGLTNLVRRNENFQMEAVNILEPARADIPAELREAEIVEEPPGVFARSVKKDGDMPEEGEGGGHPLLPAPQDLPEPWLMRAIAEVGLPQTEIQAIELNELDAAQKEADRQNPEGAQLIESSRRMRLIMANRNNPFNPAIGEFIDQAGDPRREEQEGQEGLLTQVEQVELRRDLVEHLVQTRLATLLSRKTAAPDVGVIQRAIKTVIAGSINGINKMIALIGTPPTGETYEELYQTMTQVFPEYPVFFSATTGKKLTPSVQKQSYEASSKAIGISPDGLKEIVDWLLEEAGKDRAAGKNVETFGFPPDAKGRPSLRNEELGMMLGGHLDVLAEDDRMRVLDRPEGWVGRYDEGTPSVLWALTEPKEPYGSQEPNVKLSKETPGQTKYREAKEGIKAAHKKPKSKIKTTIDPETGEEKHTIRKESEKAGATRRRAKKEEMRLLHKEYTKTKGVVSQHEATHHSTEAQRRHLAAKTPPRAPHTEEEERREPIRRGAGEAVGGEGEGEVPMATK